MFLRNLAYKVKIAEFLDESVYANEGVANHEGIANYNPYLDPNYMKELQGGTVGRAIGRGAQLAAILGGVGKTLHNLRTTGSLGVAAPIIGGLGLTSAVFDDYVQR